MDRLLVLLLVLAATAAVAAWWRAHDGRVLAAAVVSPADRSAADVVATVGSSTPLVLVEFTAPGCVPCARTKVLLDEAAAVRDDLSVVTIDVADGLDLARAHGILRAPTTLLVTADGNLLGRVAGVPRADELAALLAHTRCPAGS